MFSIGKYATWAYLPEWQRGLVMRWSRSTKLFYTPTARTRLVTQVVSDDDFMLCCLRGGPQTTLMTSHSRGVATSQKLWMSILLPSHPVLLPLFFLHSPSPSFHLLGAQILKPARSFGRSLWAPKRVLPELGRQTVSVHFEVKIGLLFWQLCWRHYRRQ